MSIQAIAWVLEYSRSEGSDRLVLLAIANHADATGGLSWPSVELIGKEARVSRRTVFRSIETLCSMGELEKAEGGGRGKTNRYQLVTWKRCQADTLKPETVSSTTLNGATGGTQNRPEPKSFTGDTFYKPQPQPQTTPEEKASLLAKIRESRS